MQNAAVAPAERVASRTQAHVGRLREIAIFVIFFAIAVISQWVAGAYSRGIGAYPDEPAHYLNGVMLRDYIVAGFPALPFDYAVNYYLHHPKLAIGYWPPAFYVVEAAWMLAFGISRTSALLLGAVVCAAVGYLVFWRARPDFGLGYSFLFGATFILLPGVAAGSVMVMTDNFVALTCLAATLAAGDYLKSPTIRKGCITGLLMSLALLTKLSAAFIVLIIPFAILLSRNWKLLGKPMTYLPYGVMLLACLPWFTYTRKMLRVGVLPTSPETIVPVPRLGEYGTTILAAAGPAVLACAVLGGALLLFRRRVQTSWAVLIAQPLAAGLVLSSAPVHLEIRHVAGALTGILLLAAYAIHAVAVRSGLDVRMRAVAVSMAICVLAGTAVAWTPRNGMNMDDGIAEASEYVMAAASQDSVFLVSSPDVKEGRLIVELATREARRPGHVTLRATKVLLDADWNITQIRPRFFRNDEVLRELDRLSVDYALIHVNPGAHVYLPQNQLLLESLGSSEHWREVAKFSGNGTPEGCLVFARRPSAIPKPTNAGLDEIRRANPFRDIR